MERKCPVCDSSGYKKFHSSLHLEPNEEWCEICGFSWVQVNAEETAPKEIDINDFRKGKIREWKFWQSEKGQELIRKLFIMDRRSEYNGA